jgi:hypothetical protein
MKFLPEVATSIAGWLRIKAVFLGFTLSLSGCLSAPTIHSPEDVPPYVRQIKYLRLYPFENQLDTGIDVREGENFSVMGTGTLVHKYANHIKRYPSSSLKIWTKNQDQFFPLNTNGATFGSDLAGRLYLGVNSPSRDYFGCFDVAIVVWKTNEYTNIFEFLSILNSKAPDHIGIKQALFYAKTMAGLLALRDKTSKEIESTSKEIAELQQKGVDAESPTGAQRQQRIQALEKKVSELSGKLADLEAKRKELFEAQQITSTLSRELDEKKRREAELISKSTQSGGRPPLLLITSPAEGIQTSSETVLLTGVAEDALGLERIEIYVNNQVEDQGGPSRIAYGDKTAAKRISFELPLTLVQGGNRIRVQAINTGGLVAEKTVFVDQVPSRPKIWAVVIGINDYPKLPKLKYAVNDAQGFFDLLAIGNQVPAANITLLVNDQATLRNLRSALGIRLKEAADRDDMVIIYFAGHGAVEPDTKSLDADGLEKYFLAYDSDPSELYATGFPMREIAHILDRIRSERLIFIVDSCYSGGSGGRTVNLTGMRSRLHDGFLDRIAGGKGKVILSASAANEVSVERDDLRHGVFTYYLLEGLRGAADADNDGTITVDEAYQYVSVKVPRATGQEQHPLKKGSVEGNLVLGLSRQ